MPCSPTRRQLASWLAAAPLGSAVSGTVRGIAPALAAGLWTGVSGPARAQTAPALIRIGVATGGVGTPPRFGGSITGLVNALGLLEKAFAPDGIRVEWIFFKGAGPAVNEALVNRQLDFAWQGDLPSIVHRAGGVKTRILLGAGVRNGLYLAVPANATIRRLEDLKGRRVAVFKGTNLHLAAVRALAARGLKESDLKLINLDNAAAQAALTTQDIDAAFGYVNLFPLRDKGVARIIWSAAEDSYRFTRQTVLLVTDEFARAQPDIVQRVVDVSVRTARDHSDESQRAALFEAWGKAEYPAQTWREDFIGQPLRVRVSPLLDPFLVARYEDAAAESFALKLVRRKPEIRSWFDRSFLDRALRSQNLEGYWPAYGADGKLLGSPLALAR